MRLRKAHPQRPYATRVAQDKRAPTEPGTLFQLDTMHPRPLPGGERRHSTAIDSVARVVVAGVRATASAGTARAFLAALVARMPVPVQAIQLDGGSAVMVGFARARQDRGIARSVPPPRSPNRNGRIARLNGTARREVWACYDGDLDLPTVQEARWAWEETDTTVRPHQALGYETPNAFLRSKTFSDVLN